MATGEAPEGAEAVGMGVGSQKTDHHSQVS